jgi:dipeptidyl aminopeptidase/acylaminoacyl peptidase
MTTTRVRRLAAGVLPIATAISGAFLAIAGPTEAAPTTAPATTTASATSATNGVIAFSDDRDGNREIYTVHADGTGLTRLTNDPALDLQPRWSPDGTRIAYLHGYHLWVMDADGTDAHEVTGYADDVQLTWSPDGTRLAFARNGAIWVVDADGTDAHEVVAQVQEGYYLDSPDWSPDGTRIAYLRSTGPGAATVHSVHPDGTGDIEISASYGHTPRWSPDGRQIAFEELGLSVQEPGAEPDRVYFLQGSEGILRGLAWAPDQTRFVFAQNSWTGSTWTHPVIRTIAADGSDLRPLTDGWTPDWQPIPSLVPETTVSGTVPAWSLTQPVFRFRSDRAGSTFECSSDGSAWQECASPYTPDWKVGDHRVAVRAVYQGNVDPTPQTVEWTAPYDDRQLTAEGTWNRVAGADSYYRGSVLSTTQQGATLSRASVRAKRLALVVTRCPSCGVVDVYYGDTKVKRVSLVADVAKNKVVLPVATWDTRQPAATVRIVVVSTGKPVRIDGLGISAR